MMESLDIIAKIDGDRRFGPIGYFKPASHRNDIKEWQKSVADNNRILQRPRYMRGSILPEFQQQDGKDAFVYNHPVPPFEKPEWKAMTYEDRWAQYTLSYEKSFGLLDETNKSLEDLNKLIYSTDFCTEGGLSYDDIDLWSRLRSMTIVRGVMWPLKLRAYMDKLSVLSDVPLYDSIAC
jgi:glutaredoxin 2